MSEMSDSENLRENPNILHINNVPDLPPDLTLHDSMTKNNGND